MLVAANLAATALRFVLFREWVFRHRRNGHRRRPGTVEIEHAR